MRDIARAGHHAAPVAAAIASSIPVITIHHGMLVASMRWLTSESIAGASASQPPIPATMPTVAATVPVRAPLASTVSRMWRSLPPIADSMPY